MPDAVRNLRSLILAGEHYRRIIAETVGLGTTESQALSYLGVHGNSGQSDLGRSLGITSSAVTALVDRLEGQGVVERARDPHDRRRLIIRLTERGSAIVRESHGWLATSLERIATDDLPLVSESLAVLANDLRSRTTRKQSDGWPGATNALPA